LPSRNIQLFPQKLKKVETNYFELHKTEGKSMLTPVPDPLKTLIKKVSRAKPIKDLDETAEEEAERMLRGKRPNAC